LLTAIWFLKFTGFGNYILKTASLLCPVGKWKLGPEWLFTIACKYIKDLIFKLRIIMCKVHKAKEYSDVFCSVIINIQCTEFTSPPSRMSVSDTLLHSGQHKYAFSQDASSVCTRMLSTNSCISLSGWMVVLQNSMNSNWRWKTRRSGN
jgi:hypothetical protein